MNEEPRARLLEKYRPYLHLLVRLEIDPQLLVKADLSGVVQLTLLEAYNGWDAYQGTTDEEWSAWLRRILANNLADEVRKLLARRRDVRREFSLEACVEESSVRIEQWLAADQSSPSHRVVRQEELNQFAAALETLPRDQRLAVELYHFKRCTLAETADLMARSRGAVASLLFRGIEKLRGAMGGRDGASDQR